MNGKLNDMTDEEDAAITAAAMADPDCHILTDEELAQFKLVPATPEWLAKQQQGHIEELLDNGVTVITPAKLAPGYEGSEAAVRAEIERQENELAAKRAELEAIEAAKQQQHEAASALMNPLSATVGQEKADEDAPADHPPAAA